MDIADIVSLIISSFALVISVLGVLYSRQRTRIVEKQLKRKERFEEVSRTILNVIKVIKDWAKTSEFHPFPLSDISSEVLGYLHDNKLEAVDISIRPKRLRLSFPSFVKTYLVQDFDNPERIINAVKKERLDVRGAFGDFDFKPIVLSDSELDFGDIFYCLKQLFSAYRILELCEKEIVVFDNTVLDDLERNIYSLLKVLIESLVSEHRIRIDSTDKSKQIYQKLLNETINLESVHVLLKELSVEICDKRLVAIQREIFSRS